MLASYRSLGFGVGVLWTVGCVYGIVRANFLDGFSHFIFDVGLVGFYIVQFCAPTAPKSELVSRRAKGWLLLLMGWPLILFLLPINNYLVQLVGLRHIVLFLPALLLGARIRGKDLNTICTVIAVLNTIMFAVAVTQYFLGIEPFFPRNAVTELMYRSHDIKANGGRYFRIPATFSNAHAYGGAMLLTLPILFNAVTDESKRWSVRAIMSGVVLLTVMGIFIAGPRLPVVCLGICAVLMFLLPGLSASSKRILAIGLVFIGLTCTYYIASDARLQRFTSLTDTEMIQTRANGSLSYSLMDSFWKYPIGVGLGGVFGSSMPYFLKDVAPEPVGAENELARIALEQGIIGFIIWIALVWKLATRKPQPISKRWQIGTHLMWALILAIWATAFVGTGMLQAIPGAFLLVFQMGILLRDDPLASPEAERDGATVAPKQMGARFRLGEIPGSVARN